MHKFKYDTTQLPIIEFKKGKKAKRENDEIIRVNCEALTD